jgi:flagellar protein FliO/FliZ
MTGVLVLVLGAAFAAAAIVAVAFIVRQTMRGPGLTLFAAKAPKRLDIVEQAVVDAKRRLVLVRRDDVEHLVMIGGPTDIVIESGIGTPRKLEPRGAAAQPLRSLGQAAGDR